LKFAEFNTDFTTPQSTDIPAGSFKLGTLTFESGGASVVGITLPGGSTSSNSFSYESGGVVYPKGFNMALTHVINNGLIVSYDGSTLGTVGDNQMHIAQVSTGNSAGTYIQFDSNPTAGVTTLSDTIYIAGLTLPPNHLVLA
jgi:hypothetical protein